MLFHVIERSALVFHEDHPVQVLEIAQTAAAILDVRLLHRGRIAEFGAARRLILHARGNVFVFAALDAFGDDGLLEFFEELFVSRYEARFDQGGFGLHVLVRDLNAFADRAHGMADFETKVPQRVQNAVHDLREMRQRLAEGDDLAGVQEHDIDVTVRIQFGAAVTAKGNQRQRRKLLLRLFG